MPPTDNHPTEGTTTKIQGSDFYWCVCPATKPAPAAQADEKSGAPVKSSNEYAIFKPNARGSGGVIRFDLNKAKRAVFVDAANQSGDKHFDWEQKITMKWGLHDIGGVLAVLQGRTEQAKLFHKSEHANSAFELGFRDDPQRAPYMMNVSRQDAKDKSVRKVAIPVTHAEAAVLEAALRAAVVRLLGW